MTLRYVPGPDATPPRVAVATTRATGGADTRNRVRRRLRAAVAANESDLMPGGAYLFAAGREASDAPFDALTEAIGQLVRSVSEPA